MGKGLLDALLDQIFDAEWVGRRGEKLTARELKLVKFFGRDGRILRNVYVPKANGETSEIDVIFITQKGIFVIESKNYSGWIFGNEADRNWTVVQKGGAKNRFYNPIKQNLSHIKWLGKFLGNDVPLFSIIAFSERCELKKVTVESDDVRVIKRDRLYATVRSVWSNAPDALDSNAVERLYGILGSLTNADEAVKAAHVATIEQRYKQEGGVPRDCMPACEAPSGDIDPTRSEQPGQERVLGDGPAEGLAEEASFAEGKNKGESCATNPKEGAPAAASSSEAASELPACPRCGAPLVLRTAKKGSRAGCQFYGCSTFPQCRFIKNL